jgi:hypothetical protein
MAKYLTGDKFKTMAFGIDTGELEDFELESLCAQASSIIDAYCHVPRLPQPHSFRGGSIVREQHQWRYPITPYGDMGSRRVYPWHKPVISVDQFRIYVTNTQYVEIAASELLINNSEGYAEVVSLAITSSGLFNALIVPNVGLAVPVAHISYTYGWELPVTDEIVQSDDGRTFRAENQFWYSDPAPVVKVNGTPVTTGRTFDHNEGVVVFDAMQAADAVVTLSYSHHLPNEIMQAAGFIVAHLHGEAELRAKGMEHVSSLQVAEVRITRNPEPAGAINEDNLSYYAPEAAALLSAYRAENITVRG